MDGERRGWFGPEQGQAVTAVSVAAMVVAIAVAVLLIEPFSRGESQLSTLKAGADAAALAGAQQIAKDAPALIRASLTTGSDPGECVTGSEQAREFASRNSVHVVSYCYFPKADRVEVRAATDEVTASGKVEEASSVASVGVRVGACTPDATPEVTASGYLSTATCGDVHLQIFVPPMGAPLTVVTPDAAIAKLFAARLKE